MERTFSDALLLDGLKAGDESSFEVLFLRYWEQVYAILFRMLGTREGAEDLAQEVFLRLYHSPPSRHREHNLGAWLYKVATNLGLNALRAERVRRNSDKLQPSQSYSDPEDVALSRDERKEVRRVLSTMPKKQQTCLILRHSGFSYKDIADILGISVASVGTLLARSERNFAQRYRETGGKEEER